jgi:uncharacterized lipoprotein YehR (DUF1307 family)
MKQYLEYTIECGDKEEGEGFSAVIDGQGIAVTDYARDTRIVMTHEEFDVLCQSVKSYRSMWEIAG